MLRINNSKAPANNTAFVVLTSLSIVSLNDCDRDNCNYCNNCNNCDGRDYREDLNNVITINSCAKTAGALTVLAVEDTS
jgi:hypothetical protein